MTPTEQVGPPVVGQVWREDRPRFKRHVRIVDVQHGRRGIAVRTCVQDKDGNWQDAARARTSWCDRERFNGKRGGYAFVAGDFGDAALSRAGALS